MGYGGVIQTLVGENAPPGLLYFLDKKVYPPLADTSRERLWWLMVTVHEQDGDYSGYQKQLTLCAIEAICSFVHHSYLFFCNSSIPFQNIINSTFAERKCRSNLEK